MLKIIKENETYLVIEYRNSYTKRIVATSSKKIKLPFLAIRKSVADELLDKEVDIIISNNTCFVIPVEESSIEKEIEANNKYNKVKHLFNEAELFAFKEAFISGAHCILDQIKDNNIKMTGLLNLLINLETERRE